MALVTTIKMKFALMCVSRDIMRELLFMNFFINLSNFLSQPGKLYNQYYYHDDTRYSFSKFMVSFKVVANRNLFRGSYIVQFFAKKNFKKKL